MQKILFASVLKPVDDIRIYHKLAKTAAELPYTQVHILGYQSKAQPKSQTITFHPLFNFSRLGFQRLLAPILFLQYAFRIKPDLLIITTHELLWPALLYNLLYQRKIIYDVQENYFLNIRHTTAFPRFVRQIVAAYVKVKEQLAHPFIDHYLLAEKCYREQMPRLNQKATLLQNKAIIIDPIKKQLYSQTEKTFIYSGTISSNYGIFEAIRFIKELHDFGLPLKFKIIGFAAQPQVLKEVQAEIRNYPFISLIGGESPVPANEIQKHMASADFALLPYQLNKSTQGRIPTKFFEYAAFGLPMICSEAIQLDDLLEKYTAGFSIDFRHLKPGKIIALLNQELYYPSGIPTEVFWNQEAARFKELLTSL